ncbi:DUF4238 domain-containing protein [Mucilaginibacter sp. CAU 1740]|uniref:DUF4238 domain-containing protein n=1 Tax=Mucilaginibacter sp. CAU 1740 TaxID=3140365 RepID=UPI00325A6788
MSNDQEIIDQHFLPQCYINGFVNESGVLYTLDLKLFAERGKVPYARESTPAKICKDKHFYTVDERAKVYNLGGVIDKYQVEKSFHNYENNFRQLIAKITTGAPLTYNEASSLIRIIIDLKYRNKFYRDKMIEPRQGRVIEEAFVELQSSFDNDPAFRAKYEGITPQEWAAVNQQVRDQLLNDPDFKKSAHLSSLVNREDGYEALLQSLIPKLLACAWVVLKSDGQFISNDNPGCSLDSNTKVNNTYFDKDFLFVIPLSASVCLTISDAQQDISFINDQHFKRYPVVDAPQNMIEMSNSFAVKNFNKIAFGPVKTLLDDLAKNLRIEN